MKRTLVVVCLLFASAIAIAYLYFSSIGKDGGSNSRVLSYIPASSSIIAQFRYDKSFRELFAGYAPFSHLNGEEKNRQVHLLDSLFGSSAELKDLLASNNIFVSLHPVKDAAYQWLFLTGIKQQPTVQEINAFFGRKLHTEQISDQTVYRFGQEEDAFYFTFVRSSLLLSFDKNLISQALDERVSKISNRFIEAANTASASNDNSPVNLFVEYHSMHSFISAMFKGKAGAWYSLFDQTNGYGRLNMNYRSDGLQFNGTSTIDSAAVSYTGLFLGQKPGSTDLVKIVPAAVSNYTVFSMSDYPRFFQSLEQLFSRRKEAQSREQLIKKITATDGINPDRDIKKFLGKEFAVFQLSSHEKVAAINLTDGSQVKFFLDIISAPYSEEIHKLNYADLFYYYYGDPLKIFAKPFYTIIDNHLFLSNSVSALSKTAQSISSGDLLYSTSSYISHNQFIANQSNISSFIHLYNSNGLIRTYLKNNLHRNFITDTSSVKKFYGISAQWSSNGTGFLTNLYAGFKTKNNTTIADTAIVNNADTIR